MAATAHAQAIKQDSQTYLTTALFQLLRTHALNEIKITTLTRRAGVSRMAFYRNYQTVADVLVAYFEPRIANLFDAAITHAQAKTQQETAFFAELKDELQLAVARNYEYVIRDIFNRHMQRYYQQTPVWAALDEVAQRYWTAFMSAGVYAIWREWLLAGQGETLEELHQLIGDFQRATMAILDQRRNA